MRRLLVSQNQRWSRIGSWATQKLNPLRPSIAATNSAMKRRQQKSSAADSHQTPRKATKKKDVDTPQSAGSAGSHEGAACPLFCKMCKLSSNDMVMTKGRFPDAPENCCADVCYPIYVANKNNATWEEMCEAKDDPNGDKILKKDRTSPGRQ